MFSPHWRAVTGGEGGRWGRETGAAADGKNAAAAAAAAVMVDGRVFRDAFQVGDEVGVSKFAGRPGLLWRPATIVGIKEKKWPVVYEIKWGTNDRYVTPFASYYA